MTRRERILKKHAEERARRSINRKIRSEDRSRVKQGLKPLPKEVTIRNLTRQGIILQNIPKEIISWNKKPQAPITERKTCGGCMAARNRMIEMKKQAEAKNNQEAKNGSEQFPKRIPNVSP